MKRKPGDVSEAAAIMEEAGYAVPDDWMGSTGTTVFLQASVLADGDDLTPCAKSTSWWIVGDDERGEFSGHIGWPGQADTFRDFASLVDAATWLVEMLRRFGLPNFRRRVENVDERLELVARPLRDAGYAVERYFRGGDDIVDHLLVKPSDPGARVRKFGVFPEPAGGYFGLSERFGGSAAASPRPRARGVAGDPSVKVVPGDW